MRVCKFGGASLSGAEGFARVREIVRACPERRVLVVSAPGKRDARDEKITDLLYACQSAAASGRPFSHLFDRVAQRFRDIAAALSLPEVDGELRAVYHALRDGASPAYAASRGEYLSARLLAAALSLPFVDAAEAIAFDGAGRLREQESRRRLARRLEGLAGAVLPGFYGADETGAIHTFSRGGSDVTGALAAAALNADVYENWKDVRGVYAADPRVVPDARCISDMTYRELRALSRLGAQVLHESAVAPVREAGVPLNIRSSLDSAHPGTWVRALGERRGATLTGVTGQRNLTLARLESAGAGAELAKCVLRRIGEPLRLFCDEDAVSVMLRPDERLPETLAEAKGAGIRVFPHLAQVSAVGENLPRLEGALRLNAALSSQGVRVLALHQPPEGLYLTAVVAQDDFERAVRAAYDAFIRS